MAHSDPGESRQHTMAYNSNPHSPYPSLGWDLPNLGVFNADMSFVMETSEPFSPPDLSTGYLQDALVEWSDRCKRRRLQLYDHDHSSSLEDALQNYWNSNCTGDPNENFNCLSQITEINRVPDEHVNSSISSISDGETMYSEMKTLEEAVSDPETQISPPYKDSPRTKCVYNRDNLNSKDPPISSSEDGRQKKKVITGVVYPFALVKPGGIQGEVTLNDRNKRILMPPTRPVRHPVGDFACRPCVSPDGPGLSGKAVVALTRIHTQGRGTITIIRTTG